MWRIPVDNFLAALSGIALISGLVCSPHLRATPFIGQIQYFPYTFPPRDWTFCNGQLLQLDAQTALFALIGTTYGGNGRTNFAVPDMRGRAPLHPGQGPGLSPYRWGQVGGSEAVTLTTASLPAHSHALGASNSSGDQTSPAGAVPARDGRDLTYSDQAPDTDMHPASITDSGGGQPHNNMPPYLALNCNIALNGIFPQRP